MAAPAAVTAIDFFCSPFMLGFWGIGAIGCGLLGPWIYHIDQHPGKRQEFQDVNSTATYLAMMEMAPNQTEISAALQGYHAPMFMLEKGGNYYIGINPSVDKVFAQAVNDATLFLWSKSYLCLFHICFYTDIIFYRKQFDLV